MHLQWNLHLRCIPRRSRAGSMTCPSSSRRLHMQTWESHCHYDVLFRCNYVDWLQHRQRMAYLFYDWKPVKIYPSTLTPPWNLWRNILGSLECFFVSFSSSLAPNLVQLSFCRKQMLMHSRRKSPLLVLIHNFQCQSVCYNPIQQQPILPVSIVVRTPQKTSTC